MNDLQVWVENRLKMVHSSVHLEKAPDKTKFPYITYELDIPGDDEDYRQDIVLEVDVWGNSPNTTEIDGYCNEIDALFHREYENNADFQVSCYRISRLMVPDPDEKIRHRNLKYMLKTYFKE